MNKDIRKWICVFFAFVFLISSTSMSIQSTFHSDVILGNLGVIAVVSSFLTLAFALSSLLWWQSFFGLAVFVYSIIWETQAQSEFTNLFERDFESQVFDLDELKC